jgi:phosphatidylinositol-3-phosphatase
MKRLLPCLLLAGAAMLYPGAARAGTLGDVFYIDMENHNATQPSNVTSPQPIYGNSAAPYINSLITPGNPNAAQVSYAPNYYNVATGVHPSAPNYIWQEQGTNNGVFNDNMPFGAGGTNQGNNPSLSGLLQAKGISWKSYQEDTQINLTTGAVLPQSQWTVPLNNQSGTIGNGYKNAYNGSNQYDFATKHDGQLYFNATNGGNNTTTTNPEISHYAPLQQLTADLASNNVARYNLITPDQFNDMHTALTNGFTDPRTGIHYTGQAAQVAQGDYFLSVIIPQIMASQAYKNNGAIVIWFDETEGGDTNQFTLPEIILSPLAKGNAYASSLNYTHSSDLKTLEELFGVFDPTTGGFLGDANTPGTNDLSDLFVPNAIVPEPTTLSLFALGGAALAGWRWRRRRKQAA